jgi:hypothetical protein
MCMIHARAITNARAYGMWSAMSNGTWKSTARGFYTRSRIYEEPEVTAVVERMTAELRDQMAA